MIPTLLAGTGVAFALRHRLRRSARAHARTAFYAWHHAGWGGPRG